MASFSSRDLKVFSTEDAKYPCVRIQNLKSAAGQTLNGKIGRNKTESPYFIIPANMSRSGIDIPVQAFMQLDLPQFAGFTKDFLGISEPAQDKLKSELENSAKNVADNAEEGGGFFNKLLDFLGVKPDKKATQAAQAKKTAHAAQVTACASDSLRRLRRW